MTKTVSSKIGLIQCSVGRAYCAHQIWSYPDKTGPIVPGHMYKNMIVSESMVVLLMLGQGTVCRFTMLSHAKGIQAALQ